MRLYMTILICIIHFLFVFGKENNSNSSINPFISPNSSLDDLSAPAPPSKSSVPPSLYPHGFDKHNRVAIIMTGQLRSANFSFSSASVEHDDGYRRLMRVSTPQMSAASTIIDRLFRPLARTHGLDVFMYLTAHPKYGNIPWDGQPESYQPKLTDTKGCEIFTNNDVFFRTGNRFFCLIEPEEELMTELSSHMEHWKYYAYTPDRLRMEQALQQIYHMYKANIACRQYALSTGINYKYKLRHRPDVAMYADFPNIDSIDFNCTRKNRPNHIAAIYHFSYSHYEGGNYDTANAGLAEHMDIYFDRYNFYLTFDNKNDYVHGPDKKYNMEEVMELWLDHHRLSVLENKNILMVVIRVVKHNYSNSPPPPPYRYQWKDLSVDIPGTSWMNISSLIGGGYHEQQQGSSGFAERDIVVASDQGEGGRGSPPPRQQQHRKQPFSQQQQRPHHQQQTQTHPKKQPQPFNKIEAVGNIRVGAGNQRHHHTQE